MERSDTERINFIQRVVNERGTTTFTKSEKSVREQIDSAYSLDDTWKEFTNRISEYLYKNRIDLVWDAIRLLVLDLNEIKTQITAHRNDTE